MRDLFCSLETLDDEAWTSFEQDQALHGPTQWSLNQCHVVQSFK